MPSLLFAPSNEEKKGKRYAIRQLYEEQLEMDSSYPVVMPIK